MCSQKSPPKKGSIKSSLSPPEHPGPVTTLIHIAEGLSSAGSALVKGSNCKVFYTQQSIVTDKIVCHTPGARMVCSAFHTIKAVFSQVGTLQTDIQACGDCL